MVDVAGGDVVERRTAAPGEEPGCLCCGTPLPERGTARGGPRLRYCPEGQGRWDGDAFSCKRHGAAVVAYRSARGDDDPHDPLAVLDRELTRLRSTLTPALTALTDTAAAVAGQQELVRRETVRVAEAEAHAEHAHRATAAATQARDQAQAAAAADRAAAAAAVADRDQARDDATRARAAATAATTQAATAEQARQDAVTAAGDAVKTREAAQARVAALTDTVAALTADRDGDRTALENLRTRLAACQAEERAARGIATELAHRLEQATADRDRATADHARLVAESAAGQARLDTLTAAVTDRDTALAAAREDLTAATVHNRVLRHLAHAVPVDAPHHPAVRHLLATLTDTGTDLLADLATTIATAPAGTRPVDAVLARLRAPDTARADIEQTLTEPGGADTRARRTLTGLAATGRLPAVPLTDHDPNTPPAAHTVTIHVHGGTPDTRRHLAVEATRVAPDRVTTAPDGTELRIDTPTAPVLTYLADLAAHLGLTATIGTTP